MLDHAAPRPPDSPRRAPWAAPTRLRARAAGAVLGAIAIAGALASGGLAYPRQGQNERASLLPDGSESERPAVPYQITPDGRYVLFELGTRDSPNPGGLYVRDVAAGRTEQVDLAADGTPADGSSFNASVSDDGRFVAFVSRATNLGVPDAGGSGIYVHDRAAGDTEQVPVSLGTLDDGWPFISGDGRFVAFQVWPGPPGPTEGPCWWLCTILLYDRVAGTTAQLLGPEGSPMRPTLSADGRYVAFITRAGLATGLSGVTDTNQTWDAYVLDRLTGKTELASCLDPGSTSPGGITSGTSSGSGAAGVTEWARLSADGRYVTFVSASPRLVPEDRNEAPDVFVRDLVNDRTERVSVKSSGAEAYGTAFGARGPTISADGRYVVFMTTVPFVPEDTSVPPFGDVYVHDRSTGATELVSVGSGGSAADSNSWNSIHTYATADGSRVLFMSAASNLAPFDYNRANDAYLRDRGPAAGVSGMAANVAGGEVSVSGSATFSGDVVTAALDAPPGAAPDADLTAARVTYRPELADLLVDLDLQGLSSVEVNGQSVPANPRITYVLRFVAGGTGYEVRAGWAADADPSGGARARHLFLLFRCEPTCLPVARLTGGYGTTGRRIRFPVALSDLGITEGAALTGIEAAAGVGHPATGILQVHDTLALPSGSVPVPTVRLGIAPEGAGEKDVTYGPPVSLVDGSFSGSVSVTGKPPGAYELWARACLGQQCGSASMAVTLS